MVKINAFSSIITYNTLRKNVFIFAPKTIDNAGASQNLVPKSFILDMKLDCEKTVRNIKRQSLMSETSGGMGINVCGVIGDNSGLRNDEFTKTLKRYRDLFENLNIQTTFYIEPHHTEILNFLNNKDLKERNVSYALWIPDLFMRRIETDSNWTLFCPSVCWSLNHTWGKAFEKRYEDYESNDGYGKIIKARELWAAIIESQIKTGSPYILYKDHANSKSNQQNLGAIKCSNFSTEIIQFTANDEIAVCNSAAISLNRFVKGNQTFDFEQLIKATGVLTRILNLMIDKSHYPLKECRNSNMRHRPISIGVQGLADTFVLMRYPFESDEAQKLNRDIFEAIYYGALKESCKLAKLQGTYETYKGSPISNGILQFDMWNVKPSGKFDFDSLRKEIKKYGVRNSLLIALMPTQPTAQILSDKSFEPYTSDLYASRVLSGDFQVLNPQLVKDLIDCKLWSDKLRNEIIMHHGSIQNINCISDDLKKLYKKSWEIPYECIINMAADRGPYIDQSQSLNIYMTEPTYDRISSIHFYAWKKGLKTGAHPFTKQITN